MTQENRDMRYGLTLILFFCLSGAVYADPLSGLTLTPAEMQKLKHYFPVEEANSLTWTGDPLSIQLPLNQEKRIQFSTPCRVDVKGALTTDQLRILNNNQSLYLTALKAFPKTRLYVTLKETGEVVLLDLMTNNEASNATQIIQTPHKNAASLNQAVSASVLDTSSEEALTKMSHATMNFAESMRFAWQSVYAPERLIQNKAAFRRAPMHTQHFVSGLFYGDSVFAYPKAAWVTGHTYVTALIIRNKYPHSLHIDLGKDLCGHWQAGLLYPTPRLKPYGQKRGDSAMLFLISERPFGDTIGVCHGDASDQ
jgi:integrating conjugative element protein (TIGR03749 family)